MNMMRVPRGEKSAVEWDFVDFYFQFCNSLCINNALLEPFSSILCFNPVKQWMLQSRLHGTILIAFFLYLFSHIITF